MTEVAIARYHLGQYTTALTEIAACTPPEQPSCVAALAMAAYINYVGINALPKAIHVAQQGLRTLENESNARRRAIWRIVLQRNLAAAYHYIGDLDAARSAAEDAVQLAEEYDTNSYLYDWALYERGLLEQRAGRFSLALEIFRPARARLGQSAGHEPIWRWIVAAEAHTLRDMGFFDEAEECYRLGGWGEGDDGPLMLWLIQGHYTEARCAAEARLATAHASEALFEVTNLNVFLALAEFQSGATPVIRTTLYDATRTYADLGFHYHHASTLFHLAAVEYALDNLAAGDAALADALRFGATQGYLNFAWWHPARMRTLLLHAVAAGIETAYSERLLQERALDQPSATETRLTLYCLGRFEVRVNDETIATARWQGHGAGAIRMQRMLLYLARHRKPQSIASIARYVWPDSWDRIDVSTNFHLTLTGLRRVFEPVLEPGGASRFVITTSGGYQLAPSLDVTIDLDDFQAQVRNARAAAAIHDEDAARAAFERAEQLYTGDFALAKPDPGEAEENRRAFLEALRWLAADDLHRGALDSCIARARQALREDRWNTVVPVLLIESYLARGDLRAARRQYQQYLKEHGEASRELARLARIHRL